MKTAKALLKTTGYALYVDDDVLATAPRSSGDENVEVFTLGKSVTNAELLKEYETRGLEPVSLDELLSVEKKYDYIMTIWDNDAYALFHRRSGGRNVGVSRSGSDWSGRWWFAGRRKSSNLMKNLIEEQGRELEPEWKWLASYASPERREELQRFFSNKLASSNRAVIERAIEIGEGMKKKIDKNRETDERRYPIGYNQAISDYQSALKELLK